jgi:hypothetical protein
MRKPKAVRVLKKWIKIQYANELEDETGPLQGLYDPEDNMITVLLNKNWQSTLYHEVIHAYFHLGGWSKNMSEKFEEELVATLELAFKKLRFNWKSRHFRY